jgi:hypothetical protein
VARVSGSDAAGRLDPQSTPTPRRARPRMTARPPSARPRRWPRPAAGCSTTPTPPPCPPAVGVAPR